MLSDNRQSWELKSDGSYVKRIPVEGEEEVSTHEILMKMAKQH